MCPIVHLYVAKFCEILQFQMGSEESNGSVELKKILDSFEAGDVLPEADIVCNILDKLARNLDLASMLLHFTEFQEVVNLSVHVCFGRRGR